MADSVEKQDNVNINVNLSKITNGYLVEGNIGINGSYERRFEATKAKALEAATATVNREIDKLK